MTRRWDVDVPEPINFGDAGWTEHLRASARTRGSRRDEFWIDLFVFKRGMYLDLPPLIVGHCYWDNWMIWKALVDGVRVIDGTSFVLVHQNHGYSAASGRIRGNSNDPLSMVNLKTIAGLGRVPQLKPSPDALTTVLRGRGSECAFLDTRTDRQSAFARRSVGEKSG